MLNNRITIVGLGFVIALAIVTATVVFLVVESLFPNIQEPGPISSEVDITKEVPKVVLLPTAEIIINQNEEETATAAIEETPVDEEEVVVATDQPPATPTSSDQNGDGETGELLYHTISAGETLYRISVSYGVPMDLLLEANGIADPWLIYAGQILAIPSTPVGYSPPATEEIAALVPSLTPENTATLMPTVTPEETLVIVPTSTATEVPPTVAPVETAVPTEVSVPLPSSVDQVNGIPVNNIVVMPDNVIQRSREIYQSGQQQGRNPHAFSKVGDSTIENPHFLARFDGGDYNLGIYGYLQPAIDFFAGSHSRQGVAVRRGFHSWTVTDPLWADKELCEPNETPIACEIRIHNPSIILIRLGSNDAGVPAGFDQNVRQIVDYAIEKGVLPVIGTKADRFEGADNINNILLRQIAADYAIPLWDFDLVAGTLPGRGLYTDDVHLTIYYAHDYTSPVALQRGHSVHNLTALMVLDRILKEVIQTGG